MTRIGLAILVLIWLFFCTRALTESFQHELRHKHEEVEAAIGKRKLRQIEAIASNIEIYRITQLFNMPDLGEITIKKLSKILGDRFGAKPEIPVCYRRRIC